MMVKKDRSFVVSILFAVFLCFVMCAGICSGNVYAQAKEVVSEEVNDVGRSETGVIWNISPEGVLTVSGTCSGDLYLNSSEWDDRKDEVKKAVLSVSGLKNADNLFYGYSNLESVDLSNFDTQNIVTMQHMFSRCPKLKEIKWDGFDTSSVIDMNYMFSGCSSLSNLDVSHFNTANVTDMGSMFKECSSLSGLDVSHFNTANVTNMNYMFANCRSLSGLDISHFNTANVTDMGGMFWGCSSLESLDVSHFNTANVTKMYDMFCGCSSLESLDVSHFNTANVTDMYDMFYGCSCLTSIDFSNFDMSSLEKYVGIWNMLGICYDLVSVKVPANLPEEILLPALADSRWSGDGYNWWDANQNICETHTATAHLPISMTYTRIRTDGKTDTPASSNPINPIQDSSASVYISNGTKFTDNGTKGRFTATSAGEVTYIGTTDKKAKSITIPNIVTYQNMTYKVTAVSAKALKGNKAIANIKIGSNVAKIGNSAIENCTKLKSITVGSGVSSIGKNAWKGCKNLKKITLNTTKLKSVGKNAFKNIHKSCRIKVPHSKKKVYKRLLKGKGEKTSVKIG